MRIYWIFGGETCYAAGGLADFVASFSTLEDATSHARQLEAESSSESRYFDWWHVFDSAAIAIVARSDKQSYGFDDFPAFEDQQVNIND